ncbi:MAG: aminotransferase class V-fold PLP-dependent enzyme [Acidobacteria bacterium]|nr:aminotransferase class V-fold PLP-dependent enzyme [Acidobacteriota bacterium]
MGCEILTWRAQFPVTERMVYLNHAAVAPLSRRAAGAMQGLAEDCLHYGSYHYDQWLKVYQGIRVLTARLIGAEPGEIAITKNTSEGIATIANGLSFRPGDRIVCFREEFPANFFPWRVLEKDGAVLDWLSIYDPVERIAEAAKDAKLLAISWVNYLSGHRVDLESIGAACRDAGCFFFLDAIQGLGAFPIDVKKCKVDALAADAHKWMLGPEGCAVLYVRQEVQDAVFPREFGWTNVAHFADYASRDMTLRPDAGRYECGTLNTIGCYGLHAAVELLLEIGVERIAESVQKLGDLVAEGAQAKGYRLAAERTPDTGAGIVSFCKDGVDSRMVVARLKEQGIMAAPRQGWVRVSPHFYITAEEIERMCQVL